MQEEKTHCIIMGSRIKNHKNTEIFIYFMHALSMPDIIKIVAEKDFIKKMH